MALFGCNIMTKVGKLPALMKIIISVVEYAVVFAKYKLNFEYLIAIDNGLRQIKGDATPRSKKTKE